MKKVLIFLLLITNQVCFAHTSIDTVQYRVHYAVKMQVMKENPLVKRDDEHILDVGRRMTHYYSRWEAGNLRIRDSVYAYGGTREEYMSVREQKGYPQSFFNYNIFRNYPEPNICMLTLSLGKLYRCEETVLLPEWEALPGDTIIENYPCQRAQATFRGKTWQVWYTTDIPIDGGPLKLWGLPGLILQAEDTEHEYTFQCIGIKKNVGQDMVLRDGKYVKISPEELQRFQMLSGTDIAAFLQKSGMPLPKTTDGKPYPLVKFTPCLWEYYDAKHF